MTATQISNLEEFDGIAAKGLARNQARHAEQAAFLAACREWLAEQTESMSAVYAIQAFAKANPELYPL